MSALTIHDFDYHLPEDLIATKPANIRDESRLLVVHDTGENNVPNIQDLLFKQIIEFIEPSDLVIFNNTKVIKARLFGQKISGGKIELLIERIHDNSEITAHVRSNKSIYIGLQIILPNQLSVTVIELLDGLFKLKPQITIDWLSYLTQFGHIPLPPYIKRNCNESDDNRYQTVYAKDLGSIAAPTAGLHFTTALLEQIRQKGAQIGYVTLHVGSGTFKPVSVELIEQHKMHSEHYCIDKHTVDLIKKCKKNGGNIIAVGTTSIRVLETIAKDNYNNLTGETDIFITPSFQFKLVDKLITNFHLPKSTLLMLVSAFSGINTIKQVYRHAVTKCYHFFSYGDAMLLTREQKGK